MGETLITLESNLPVLGMMWMNQQQWILGNGVSSLSPKIKRHILGMQIGNDLGYTHIYIYILIYVYECVYIYIYVYI